MTLGIAMKHSKLVLTLLAIGALFVLIDSCKNQNGAKEQAAVEQSQSERLKLTSQVVHDIGLQVMTAELRPLTQEIVVASKIVANQDYEAQVGTFVPGRVSKVLVNLGDHVRRGQELMEIEGVEVGEIKSRFIKAKAQLAFAEASLNRQQSLLSQNVGAQKSVLEAQAEYEKSRAEFIAEDRRIHSVGLTDEEVERFVQHSATDSSESHVGGFLPIKSPIDGVVVERNVVIGQPVDQASTAFKVVNTSTLWVDGQVHEEDVKLLRSEPRIFIVVPAISVERVPGHLLYVGELVDQQTRMVKVRAALPNKQRFYKPEMFAELHIPSGNNVQGIAVGTECVVSDGAQHYVFVAVNDTTFEKRDVIAGITMGDRVEIKEGLKVGEKVVSKGAFMLKSELKKESFGEGE
jgi:cobalt-zinc-cadmium efflux system membrane fusion protein